MARTQRETDQNNAGGTIDESAVSPTVFVNNLFVSVNGTKGTADALCSDNNIHCTHNWQTNEGCPTVFAYNIPVNFELNKDSCDHVRVGGSSNVFVCALTGAGAIVDDNPPYTLPTGALGPNPIPVPAGAQPTPPTGYETNTSADIHIIENNDDPDGTLGGPAPLTTVMPRETLNTDTTQPPSQPPPTQDCSTIDSLPADFNWATVETVPGTPDYLTFKDFADSFSLSPNFTVADLTLNTAVSSYSFTSSVTQACGATQKEILQNLCHHAKTALEPMLARYGSFTITSGFRNKTGTSQHNRGQATDIQFLEFHGLSNTGQLYFDRAKDVRDNINFDQLILEWFARNPWLHISSNPAAHRNNVLTQVSPNSYKSGLILLG